LNTFYSDLTAASQIQAPGGTVLVFDFTDEFNDLEKMLLFLKMNKFQFPTQLADRVLIHLNNKYYLFSIDGININKQVYRLLIKVVTEKIIESVESTESENNVIDVNEAASSLIQITDEQIKKAILKKYSKQLSDLEVQSIKTLTENFIRNHPDIQVNLGDLNELAQAIEFALKNSVKTVDSSTESKLFEELLREHEKQFVYKQSVNPDKIHNKKTIGINALKATGIQWVTDSGRTKVEFDENLDRNIEKLVESLDDPDFGLHVLGIDKKITDDGRSRFIDYIIKIKPERGRAYQVKLRIPALVHGTYFKIGGNYYVINNQLMQKPIIKKSASEVQLKTNYSVTTYSIKSFPQHIKSYDDLVNKFLGIMKTAKKLKDTEVMDAATENRLRDYGVPVDEIAKINYKKIDLKDIS